MPGYLESAPFEPSTFMAIPIMGYPGSLEIDLYVECVDSARRLALVEGHLREAWYERTLWMPRRWCDGPVRLVAVSHSTTTYVAVGTPFRSSAWSYLKESAPVLLVVHALSFAALLAPGLALASWLGSRRLLPGPMSLATIPLTALLGYACFFLTYYGGMALGTAASLGVAWAGVKLWRNARTARLGEDLENLVPLGLMFCYSLLCVLLLYMPDARNGTWTANFRYSPAIWSSDNQLQQMIAEELYRGGEIGTGFRPWKVSDRPPLFAGTLVLLRPLWQMLLGVGENARLYYYFHQVTGIVLSSFWVIPVWHLVRRTRLSARGSVAVVMLVGATGFALFNSTYTWPKLLAGALALICYMVLTDEGGQYGGAGSARSWTSLGLCGGLSLMCHGGVLFGMLPLLPGAIRRALRGRLVPVLLGCAVFAAVVLPWMTWQRVEAPPGNALVKFAFAGTWGFGEEDVGVWETAKRAYLDVTPAKWWAMRLDGIEALFGAHLDPMLVHRTHHPDTGTLAGRLRLGDFLYPFPSMRFLNVGWLLLALLLFRRSAASDRSAAAWRMALTGVAGLAVTVLLLWRAHVIHTFSYLSILLIAVALATILIGVPSWLARAAAAAQVGYFLVVWIVTPLLGSPGVRWGFVAAAVLVCAAGWWLLRLASLLDAPERGRGALSAPLGEP